jgi:TonB family protein
LSAGVQAAGWSGPSRRRVPRFQVQAPLDVTVLRSGIPDKVPGRSVNVSERGIAAVMAGELTAGETVGVELRLPLVTDPVLARALVKYQDKLRCGLEFLGLSAEQRAAIRDWAKEAKAETETTASPMPAPETKIPEIKKPETKIPETKKTETKISGTRLPETKTADAGEIKETRKETKKEAKPEAKPEAKKEVARVPTPEPPKKKRLGGAWVVWLILILFWTAVAAGILWWRWNREWAALESGLNGDPTTAAEKAQAQVSAEVMEKLVVHRVEPVYPAEARQQNLQGIIALDIVVGRDGSVVSMHALNGPDVLARAAMDALRWWKFEPYRVNGEPAVVETTVAVEFKR